MLIDCNRQPVGGRVRAAYECGSGAYHRSTRQRSERFSSICVEFKLALLSTKWTPRWERSVIEEADGVEPGGRVQCGALWSRPGGDRHRRSRYGPCQGRTHADQ